MSRFLALGLVAVVFVTSCGYKGPLVMPEKPAAGKALTEKPAAEKPAKQKTP